MVPHLKDVQRGLKTCPIQDLRQACYDSRAPFTDEQGEICRGSASLTAPRLQKEGVVSCEHRTPGETCHQTQDRRSSGLAMAVTLQPQAVRSISWCQQCLGTCSRAPTQPGQDANPGTLAPKLIMLSRQQIRHLKHRIKVPVWVLHPR